MAANGKQKNRNSLNIASLPLGKVYGITDKGYYLDKDGMPFKNVNGKLESDGDYIPRKHGALIPKGLVKRDSMKINGKKKGSKPVSRKR